MQPFRARLLDGVTARLREGEVALRHAALVFRAAGARDQVPWAFDRVVSIHRVAGAVHVELSAEGAGPTLQLVVDDPAFEAALEEARDLCGASPGGGVGARLRRLRWKGWLAIAAAAVPLAFLVYTVLVPHAHVLVSRDAERALGEYVYASVVGEGETVDDPALRALAAAMVVELTDPASGFEPSVTFLRDGEPNAFALPGGRIVVHDALLDLCPSPDALAGVLAHEIAHVEQRHGLKHLLRTLGVLYFAGCVVGGGVEEFATAETVAELSSGLLVLRHSRETEREADALAVAKLRANGRSTAGLREFFLELRGVAPDLSPFGEAWWSTHPLTSERIASIPRDPPGTDAHPWMESAAWQALRARLAQQRR